MYNIRNYKKEDYSNIKSWWDIHNEPGPLETMLPEESTFILELNSVPIYAISIYLTNCPEICYAENFISNPLVNSQDKNEASRIITNYALKYVKDKGYKKILALAYKDKLKARYQELGMIKTLDNLSSFVKEVE